MKRRHIEGTSTAIPDTLQFPCLSITSRHGLTPTNGGQPRVLKAGQDSQNRNSDKRVSAGLAVRGQAVASGPGQEWQQMKVRPMAVECG